jgi:hypothetical protein
VSDAVTLARTARESLARGLSALQSDPSIPPQILDLAAPIAQAMAALHSIERSGGAQIQPAAQQALTNVQGALAQLQTQPAQYQAVAAAMEAVAGALASVHALSRAAAPAAAAPAAGPPPAAQQPPQYAQPQAPYGQPQAQPPQGQGFAYAPTAMAAAQPQYAPPPQGQPAPSPFGPTVAAAAPQRGPAPGGPGGSPMVIAAELGAHSPSNFYKGLSGNDVVDHGGLFVSTYKLPKLGEMVRLRVSMPGGYEFEANAIVRWRREPSDTPGDAPPGFGAQLAEITPDARQLVYRYVRNREPMFHDDL